MRSIGNLTDEQQARLFGDHLFAQQIENEVDRDSDGSWLIWVSDDDQLEEAGRLLEKFRANPQASEFARTAGSTERHKAEQEEANRKWRRRFYDRTRVFPNAGGFRPGPVSISLIGVCAVIGILSGLGNSIAFLKVLYISATLDSSVGLFHEVRSGEIWRLFTPVLLHFGWMHLLFNMMWLFQLGSMIEARQGHVRLGLLILVIALISNVAQYLISGDPRFGGMSGVVYGLFGYIWIRSKLDPASGLFIDQRSVVLMIVWFVLCFTGWVGPIANTAHAGGLIVGATWGWLSAWLVQRKP